MTQTRLTCRAEHPMASKGDRRFKGRLCGQLVQVHPYELKATGRVLTRWEDVREGNLLADDGPDAKVFLGVRCAKCGMISEFEFVAYQVSA